MSDGRLLALWLFGLAGHLLDGLITAYALASFRRARELNPVVGGLHTRFGGEAIILLKIGVAALVLLTVWILVGLALERYVWVLLGLFVCIGWGPVLWNVWQLVQFA